jgi:hypothetical protein
VIAISDLRHNFSLTEHRRRHRRRHRRFNSIEAGTSSLLKQHRTCKLQSAWDHAYLLKLLGVRALDISLLVMFSEPRIRKVSRSHPRFSTWRR